MNNLNYYNKIIKTDIETIFNTNLELEYKFIIIVRSINTIFILLDSVFLDKDYECLLYKKMLVIYNYLINANDIVKYDIYLSTIYSKIKKNYSCYAEKLHKKIFEQNRNAEYNLYMIYYYKNSDENLYNLYKFYYKMFKFKKCIKLLTKNMPNYFDEYIKLQVNLGNYNEIERNYSKIFNYYKKNTVSPEILKYIGINNFMIKQLTINYFNNLSCNTTYSYNTKNNNLKIAYIINDNYNKYYNLFIKDAIKIYNTYNFSIYVYDFSYNNTQDINKKSNYIYKKFNINNNTKNDILKKIRLDNINIVINLCNLDNTLIYYLLYNKIGEIQINYYNYLGTISNNIINYFIGDKYLIDNNLKMNLYEEKILYLPNSFLIPKNYKNYKNVPNIKLNHEKIINLLIKHDTNSLKKSILDNYYIILENYIDDVLKGIYNKELLLERKIKLLFEKENDNQVATKLIMQIELLKEKDKINPLNMNLILPKPKQKNYFKFCCLSRMKKITKKDIILYTIILEKCPNSVIYFIDYYNKNNVLSYFDTNLHNRIYFLPVIKQKLHLIRLLYFDLILDTTTYNLKNSVLDSLWCGIPIISIKGSTPESRITYSILKNINFDELISENTRDFIINAARLYQNNDHYKQIKTRLEDIRNNSIFNKKIFIDNLCKLYLNLN